MSFYDATDNFSSFSIGFGRDPKDQFGIFAKGYANAAATLAKDLLLREYRPRDYEAYPIVFLYRHALELSLKNILLTPGLLIAFKGIKHLESQLYTTHDLVKLSGLVAAMLRGLFPDDNQLEQISQNMLGIAAKFAKIDPGSFAYRYPTDKNGNHSTPLNQTVSLQAFHATMSQLLGDLEVIDFGINVETDIAQEFYETMMTEVLAEQAFLNE